VVQRAYDWTLWIVLKVEKFPRSQRYSIGEQLVRASVDLLLHLVDATYQTRNSGTLGAAVREANRVRVCGAPAGGDTCGRAGAGPSTEGPGAPSPFPGRDPGASGDEPRTPNISRVRAFW